MLFNSLPFLLAFLPVTFGVYALLPRREETRCWYLIVISLGFYGYWDMRLLPLLIASIIGNWLAVQLFRSSGKRLVLVGAIAADLLVLGYFKYAGFFVASLDAVAGANFELASVALPLGISFFTFHHIIYLADLLHGGAPHYRFRDYALYILFFPQILAGPIVRHREFIPQIAPDPMREGHWERSGRGAVLLAIGLLKKIFVADTLAAIATPLFTSAASGTPLGFSDAWTAALAFTFQIYFDFSGYSDMAIGLALMFGFVLPVNFTAPYQAASLQDFWRRWHMTLSRFLRDYLYIPLGGNRFGLNRQIAALMITMALGGLWHGAGWTFVIWGVLHGFGLSVGVITRRLGIHVPYIVGWFATFLFVVASWVFFRAADLGTALNMFAAMLDWRHAALPGGLAVIISAAAISMVGPTSQDVALQRLKPWSWAAMTAAGSMLVVLLQLGNEPGYEFIYFRF